MKSYEDLKKDFGSMEIYEPLELSKKIVLCDDMTSIVQESDLKHEVALKELLIFCLKTFQMLSLLDRDDNITNFNREVSKFITSLNTLREY